MESGNFGAAPQRMNDDGCDLEAAEAPPATATSCTPAVVSRSRPEQIEGASAAPGASSDESSSSGGGSRESTADAKKIPTLLRQVLFWPCRYWPKAGRTANGAAALEPEEAFELPPVPAFIISVLHGISQVGVHASSLSGILFIAGLVVGDPRLAGLAILGCTSATAVACLTGQDATAISDGLFGYNGALHGSALSAFLGTDFTWTVLATIAAGAASALFTAWLGKAMRPIPQFTLVFNVVTLAILACRQPLAAMGNEATRLENPHASAFRVFDALDWLEAILSGISQILFVGDPSSGVIVVIGMFCHSPFMALAAFIGSLIGTLGAAACAADVSEVREGTWAFNAILTAPYVSVSFVPLGPAYLVLMLGGAALATALFAGMKWAAAVTIACPCLTLPFCTVGLLCILLGGGCVRGLVRAPTPHSPEANLSAYSS